MNARTDVDAAAATNDQTAPEPSARELRFTDTPRPAPSGPDTLSIAWLDWCQREGIPATTISRRRSVLRSIGNAGTATREDLEAWWDSRTERELATRATDLACVRSFYRWAKLWEHRDDDPSARLRRPKVSQGMPRPVEDGDLEHLLTHYRVADPELCRAYALGALVGLRVSEAASLRWADVDHDSRHITVRGKGGKTRRVAVDQDTLDVLGAPGAPTASVVTGTSTTLGADLLRRRANRGLKRAGVPATFHQLRHRFGTKAYQASKDIVAVRNMMGHASIATTSVYAAAAEEVAQQIASAVSLRLPRRQVPASSDKPGSQA